MYRFSVTNQTSYQFKKLPLHEENFNNLIYSIHNTLTTKLIMFRFTDFEGQYKPCYNTMIKLAMLCDHTLLP